MLLAQMRSSIIICYLVIPETEMRLWHQDMHFILTIPGKKTIKLKDLNYLWIRMIFFFKWDQNFRKFEWICYTFGWSLCNLISTVKFKLNWIKNLSRFQIWENVFWIWKNLFKIFSEIWVKIVKLEWFQFKQNPKQKVSKSFWD